MEFFKYVDSWTWAKKLGLGQQFKNRDDFWKFQSESSIVAKAAFVWRQTEMEKAWIKLERPYYQVFPAIVPMLLNLKLSIPCSALLNMSMQPVELRLPTTGNEDLFAFVDQNSGKPHRVESIIFGLQEVPTAHQSQELCKGLVVFYDVGEKHDYGYPILMSKFFPLREDLTLQEACDLLPKHHSYFDGVIIPEHIILNVVRLCTCVALIDQDPEVVSADILVDDLRKWDAASAEERLKLIEKAHRRGKKGWNIGKQLEVMPHYRRPHPAVVWTGKGRNAAKIVLRKGSIVHRNKVTSVPTGFESDG